MSKPSWCDWNSRTECIQLLNPILQCYLSPVSFVGGTNRSKGSEYSQASFTLNGTPCRGPRSRPVVSNSSSSLLACDNASLKRTDNGPLSVSARRPRHESCTPSVMGFTASWAWIARCIYALSTVVAVHSRASIFFTICEASARRYDSNASP